MQIEEIKTVCFVGAGQMGCFNSLLAGIAGYDARVYDSSSEALNSLRHRQQQMLAYLVEQEVVDSVTGEKGIHNVRTVVDPAEAAAGADLLSESVPERLELKLAAHHQFDALCPPKTIFSTNTSSFLPSEIAPAVARQERFGALHSHLGSLLFDIVGGTSAAPQTIDVLVRYVHSLHGTPIVHTKELRGYVANVLFGAVNSASLRLVIERLGSPEDVDRAWMTFQQARMGPFAMMDFIGLDVVADVTAVSLQDKLFHDEARQIIVFLQPYVDRGDLGVKTGCGFYAYPQPEYLHPDFLSATAAKHCLYAPVIRRLLAAAIWIVARGEATTDVVDLTWKFTTRSQLGPFGMLKSNWPEILLDEFTAQVERIDPDGVINHIAEALRRYI